jgi:hypothetical protein
MQFKERNNIGQREIRKVNERIRQAKEGNNVGQRGNNAGQ